MSETPFIPVAGRSALLERVRGAALRHAPPGTRALVSRVLRPYRSTRERIARWRRIRRALPPELRGEFVRMWREAHARWWRGETSPTAEAIELPIRDTGRRLWVRPGTSDVLLYADVIVHEQYGRTALRDVRTIVDCGANVGFVSAYLLARCPGARLVALEPDPVNHAMCVRNLAQFGDRATVLRAALWGSAARMRVVAAGREGTWASTVAPVEGDGADAIEGVTLDDLLERYAIDTIDLLKIDIEGAEGEVFAAPELRWLDRVRCLEIELENAETTRIFFRAMEGRPFTFVQSGDAVIATRVR
jgi:FkbM family methyltransferase